MLHGPSKQSYPSILMSCRHSGPQGKVVPLTIINDPCAWTAESLKGKESEYTYELTENDLTEIIASTDKIKSRIPNTEEALFEVGIK
jgi:hypothetical protein